MWTDFFLTSLIVAGIAVRWRNLLQDSSRLRDELRDNLPPIVSKQLTCGGCFTYWLALLAVIIFQPLRGWDMPLRWSLSARISSILLLFCSWMAVAFVAVFLRFAFAVLSEQVHYQMHHLNKRKH